MKRNEIIENLKECFSILELVCPHCYNKFGDKSWQFLSTELLSALYTLRFKIFNVPITVNNWNNGGNFSQRGLRCNMCELVKNKNKIYLSAHILGKAVDFNVKGLDTQEVYDKIRNNIDLFEYPIRIEANSTTWCHLDTYQPNDSNLKLIEFRV